MAGRLELLSSTFKPSLAIMLYQSGEEYYLESHNINDAGQLAEGKPLLQETVQGMVDVFFDDRKNQIQIGGFIPDNILSFDTKPGGQYHMIWYRPAEIRFIHFAAPLKLKSTKAWVPPMIYEVNRKEFSVYTFRGAGRPNMKTKLLRAPFHNVSDNGDVCLGNAKVNRPKVNSYAALMKYWEDLFWLSEFSHLNGASNPTKADIGKVWKRILSSRTRLKWSQIDEMKPYRNHTLNALYK